MGETSTPESVQNMPWWVRDRIVADRVHRGAWVALGVLTVLWVFAAFP
jgi:hypothetical protein